MDITKYRSTLKNQSIIDEAERLLKNFKPVTYDVDELVKAVEAFETKAVSRDSPQHPAFLVLKVYEWFIFDASYCCVKLGFRRRSHGAKG